MIHMTSRTEIRKKHLSLSELEEELEGEKDKERYKPLSKKRTVKPING